MAYVVQEDRDQGNVAISVNAVWVGDDALTPVAYATVNVEAATSDPAWVGLDFTTNLHQSFWRQEYVGLTVDGALALAQVIWDALAGPVPSMTVEAFTCDDDPQSITVEVASAPGEFAGVFLSQWWGPVQPGTPPAQVIIPDVDDAAALAVVLTAAADMLAGAHAAA